MSVPAPLEYCTLDPVTNLCVARTIVLFPVNTTSLLNVLVTSGTVNADPSVNSVPSTTLSTR